MKTMQQQAAQALAAAYSPPQRYGTAFHITPPYTDVRQLPLENFTPGPATLAEKLSSQEQAILQEYVAGDAYGLWHMAHLPTAIIRISAGTKQTLAWESTGWSSQFRVVVVEPAAELTLTDDVHNSALAIHRHLIIQHADSRVAFWGVRRAADFLNESLAVHLIGSGAATQLTHVGMVGERHQVDCHIRVWHQAPHTTSGITARFAATDHGLALYRGLIDVSPSAHGTQGYQQGKGLLLSPTAIVDFLPELAIKTNDVKCSHGVTMTHLDDSALFYLRSRGLAIPLARQLATRGFFHHQLTLPPKVAALLEDMITAHIDQSMDSTV